jgi:ectoine hydroxylase-related dioxygenase (phytanoyl-CoA dioxygenase family)
MLPEVKPMKPFREIEARNLTAEALKSELNTYGYALIRNLLPSITLTTLLADVTPILRNAQWLSSSQSSLSRSAAPDTAQDTSSPRYKAVYDEVFSLPSLHRLPHHPLIRSIVKLVIGDHPFIHPKPEARLIFPNFTPGIVHAHQDHTAVQGAVDTYTAWLPLHDCPRLQGPLQILEASHRFGLQPSETTGYLAEGKQRGGSWAGGDIRAGDFLLFHSLTVHRAAPNRSTMLRISVDFRFQSLLHPVNPAVLVFAGSGRRTWDTIYANWPSNELKFYWLKLPLHLSPSPSQLADLAHTAESPQHRERYAKILDRLNAQHLAGSLA